MPYIKQFIFKYKILSGCAIGLALLAGLYFAGSGRNEEKLIACNSGYDAEACEYVLSLSGDSYKERLKPDILKAHNEELARQDRIEKRLNAAKNRVAKDVKKKAAKAEAQAVADRADLDKRRAEYATEVAAERAKFKAEGWFQVATGIYGRWCTQTCNNSKVIGDSTYWLMEVWAKDRAAGDIYARINILSNGTVVGWTNDTAYLSLGQKGILTFSSYQKGSTGAELTEFNARGY